MKSTNSHFLYCSISADKQGQISIVVYSLSASHAHAHLMNNIVMSLAKLNLCYEHIAVHR